MRRKPTSLDRPRRRSTAGLGSWLASHPVEIVFTAIVGAAFVYLLRITGEASFHGDDWRLILQAGSFRGMLEPYSDHLSVTILAVYRTLIEVYGFSYGPFRVVGLLCLLGVPVTYYFTTRRLLGPPLAAIAALSMLGFGKLELRPATLNHYLALVGGIGCAAALNRGRRADWPLAAALALSLSAAGGGVAVAAACLIHNAAVRPPLRRWLAVLGPCLLWASWWLVAARGKASQFSPTVQPTFSESLGYARDIALTPFEHLGLGNPVLTVVLAVAFVGYGLWRLRQGLVAAANFLAWSTAIGVWAVGLAYARGRVAVGAEFLQSGEIYIRYQFLALGFALLAIVPRRQIRWPARFSIATDPRWLTAAAVMILVVGWTGGMAIRSDVEDVAGQRELSGRNTKGELIVLDLGPEVIPDNVTMDGFIFVRLQAGDVRSLLDRYGGNPFPAVPASADQELVGLGLVKSRPDSGRNKIGCERLREPVLVPAASRALLSLWSPDTAVEVDVRRFGTEWVRLDEAGPGEGLVISLPRLHSGTPWEVRANGACAVRPRGG